MEHHRVAPLDPLTAHNRATYDRIAPAYAASKRTPAFPRVGGLDAPRLAFAERLAAGARVADLGCGPGEDAEFFSARGLEVIGVDLSLSMARLAVARLAAAGRGSRGAAVGDLRALPLGDGSLDGAWSAAALLHVPDADTALVLSGVRRALRPGGLVGLVTALGDGVREEPVPYAAGETRWFVYRDPARLGADLELAGLHVAGRGEVAGNRRWGWFLALAV